jgi:transcription initiation factor IIE alpha subunit
MINNDVCSFDVSVSNNQVSLFNSDDDELVEIYCMNKNVLKKVIQDLKNRYVLAEKVG